MSMHVAYFHLCMILFYWMNSFVHYLVFLSVVELGVAKTVVYDATFYLTFFISDLQYLLWCLIV